MSISEGENVVEANLMNFKNLEQWAEVQPPEMSSLVGKPGFGSSVKGEKRLSLFS